MEDNNIDMIEILKEMAELNMFSDREQDIIILLLEDKIQKDIAIDLKCSTDVISLAVKKINTKITKYIDKKKNLNH